MRNAGTLRIGTRASQLAIAQTQLFIQRYRDAFPEWSVEIVRISTKGDRVQDRPLASIGGKALFVEEIEDALRSRTIDVAVHSAKDIPSSISDDMELAAFLPRADARDVYISHSASTLATLRTGARIGTSSPRRVCQTRALRGDLDIAAIRGNVDTRLAKLDRGEYDAIILAAAGLDRLGLIGRATEFMSVATMLPCAGQGAIAIEAIANSMHAEQLRTLNDNATATAVIAERAFAARVDGTCESPVAAHATIDGSIVSLSAMIGNLDGQYVSATLSGETSTALVLGTSLANALLDGGGATLLGRHD